MVPFAIFVTCAVLISSGGVDCGYASAASGSHASSDGTGGTFSQTNNNGQGQFSSTGTQPPGGFQHQFGAGNPYNPGYYGPANFNQNGFGANYGPGFGYNPFLNANPIYNPFPASSFGFNSPFIPFQPVPSPQEFNNYLNSLQQQYIAGGTFAQTTPGATAFAKSYLGPTKFYKQHQDYLNAFKHNQPNAFGPGPNYAYATGAYGPNGIHQTAGVFPPIKNKPNVDNRFGAEDNAAGVPPNGYFGVSTSSFSSSSDVNGVKKHKEAAITTVNDNGKVTQYAVEN